MAPPEGGSKSSIHNQGPETNNSEFRWGVKRGAGAKGKEIQFYDSFTYEGVEYSRYDCVYLHKEGEPDPYIGKIIKIWDDRKDKKKKMKVLWFFRPIEIRNWVEVDSSPANKEIFLAVGEGKGVFNINVLPWDERLRKGYEQKAVIQLQNFDPSYTSSEIEDIMWHIFGERCTAKVIPRTAFSNLKCGEAFVIFRSKEGADMAVKKLDESFLMLSDGRPLIATKAAAPVASGKPKFAGHISIEKHKLQMHRHQQAEDMRKAVSTSHCSQPNTIEYEMAMEWRLLQEKSECWWRELYKQEDLELDKVKRNHLILNSKKKLDK